MEQENLVKRAPRVPLDVEVNCDGKKYIYSKNISESGIALIADHDFQSGQFIQMKFFLPGVGQEINAHGKIVRSVSVSENFFEIGVSFWHVEEDDQQILVDFFKKQK